MTNTDITPALTPDVLEDIELYGHADMVEQTAWTFADWPRVMAIANHALPDDDPRKITGMRVEALRIAMEYWRPQDGDGAAWDEFRVVQQTLREFHSALAALLPPA